MLTLCDLYAIVVKNRVYVVDKIRVLRPLINTHENINLTDSGGVWRRVLGLMEKDGTYIVVGVMVGGGCASINGF